MSTTTRLLIAGAAALLSLHIAALADERSECAAGNGSLLVGTVLARPTFVAGKSLQGIALTHTHVRIRADADGKIYDLAVDDVFASGYQPQTATVPAPLNTITVGQRLEACGLPYVGGMHWVHNNCGDVPTPHDPNGWLKVVDASGTAGPNLEDSQKYCYLWPRPSGRQHHRGRHRHGPSTTLNSSDN